MRVVTERARRSILRRCALGNAFGHAQGRQPGARGHPQRLRGPSPGVGGGDHLSALLRSSDLPTGSVARQWFLGGPAQVSYDVGPQLSHRSRDAFIMDLRAVWRNVRCVHTHVRRRPVGRAIRRNQLPTARPDRSHGGILGEDALAPWPHSLRGKRGKRPSASGCVFSIPQATSPGIRFLGGQDGHVNRSDPHWRELRTLRGWLFGIRCGIVVGTFGRGWHRAPCAVQSRCRRKAVRAGSGLRVWAWARLRRSQG